MRRCGVAGGSATNEETREPESPVDDEAEGFTYAWHEEYPVQPSALSPSTDPLSARSTSFLAPETPNVLETFLLRDFPPSSQTSLSPANSSSSPIASSLPMVPAPLAVSQLVPVRQRPLGAMPSSSILAGASMAPQEWAGALMELASNAEAPSFPQNAGGDMPALSPTHISATSRVAESRPPGSQAVFQSEVSEGRGARFVFDGSYGAGWGQYEYEVHPSSDRCTSYIGSSGRNDMPQSEYHERPLYPSLSGYVVPVRRAARQSFHSPGEPPRPEQMPHPSLPLAVEPSRPHGQPQYPPSSNRLPQPAYSPAHSLNPSSSLTSPSTAGTSITSPPALDIPPSLDGFIFPSTATAPLPEVMYGGVGIGREAFRAQGPVPLPGW